MKTTLQAVDTLYATGHWLVSQDRHRDAISVFRTMLLFAARDERGWLGLVTCHDALGENDKALSLSRIAASVCDGGAIRCTIARSRIHRTQGDEDAATDARREAERLAEALGDDDLRGVIASERSTR
jgi:hypothetical protein